MSDMDQTRLDFDPLHKRTRKEVFLDEMNQVVPWGELVALIQPHARGAHQALGGRPPFPIVTMLRIHCLQLWWNLSDPAMEEELYERPLYRRFAGLEGTVRMPDETTILRFRHLLEKHELTPKILAVINAGLARQGLMLKTGTIVDAPAGPTGVVGLYCRRRVGYQPGRAGLPAPAVPVRAGPQRLAPCTGRAGRGELPEPGCRAARRAVDGRRRAAGAPHRQPVGGLQQPGRARRADPAIPSPVPALRHAAHAQKKHRREPRERRH
jgi:IS5 family transposase